MREYRELLHDKIAHMLPVLHLPFQIQFTTQVYSKMMYLYHTSLTPLPFAPTIDMLEVGCAHGPGGEDDPGLTYTEARTHFGAWCIVSSPLILSHDTNDDTVSDEIWSIISNTEAIGINQAWAGDSGKHCVFYYLYFFFT